MPKHTITVQTIEKKIFFIRGHKVMLDADLAKLYGVATKSLNLAVHRNKIRFPEDFMFQLTEEETRNLRFQFETSSYANSSFGWGGRRYRPTVFTEQGVAMLSSVLRSKHAALVNISIMRTFVRLREIMTGRKDLAKKLSDLEKRLGQHGARFQKVHKQIKELFEIVWTLMTVPGKPGRRIGFRNNS